MQDAHEGSACKDFLEEHEGSASKGWLFQGDARDPPLGLAGARQRGAYTGSVEAKTFSLPNPGGGRDLLENATFTLVQPLARS